MYISDRLFSEYSGEILYSVSMTEEEYNLYSNFREKSYSLESKLLWAFAPGSYQAKEAGKFAYGSDSEEYDEKRAGLALKGFLTPITATVINQKAREMAEEGKSRKEIKDYIENKGKYHSTGRVVGGTAEALLQPTGPLGHYVAQGVGLYDKVDKNRASDLERHLASRKKKKRK